MSDSVDRVFSHALNTVNKIRTGSQKPPSAIRLRLYGLYKQAMEGDVDGIMECPRGNDEQSQRAREKWDAWKQQNHLSRTEAKRRYITTLIDTMHKYASPSPDSRELVSELEFVWDQVKSNVPSSSSSSPLRTLDHSHELGQSGRAAMDVRAAEDVEEGDDNNNRSLRIKSPMSQSEEEDAEANNADQEIFVDAPDSQYEPENPHHREDDADAQPDTQTLTRTDPIPIQTPTPAPRNNRLLGAAAQIPMPNFSTPAPAAGDAKWRKRIEQSLIKMTAEVAALREQLEARRLFAHSAHYRLFRSVWRWCWAAFKHVAVDVLLLGLLLLWMRRKEDRRLEGAIRVLLGDAVALVQRRSGNVLGRVRVPGLRLGLGTGKGGGVVSNANG
ncbi:hypothetical protein BDW02DRAFT_593074 [Decorospora gaudefroyi]|uniref:ACB domain-containing protein n=1 Tax=Decorospora gaudefroyi TaxID=184978 RepID=A0A6A5K5M0_9PLEO|nr:hypothetical protein BDW02DRAFT_593074 [Decorospora gaudefroyi]